MASCSWTPREKAAKFLNQGRVTMSAEQAVGEEAGDAGMSEAQRVVLERCLRALRDAGNDSETLAALLLITRFCPAGRMDRATLRRVFEAVGFSLPNRLLVSAATGGGQCPPGVLLSLGVSLLAGFSADPELAAHPQLINKVSLLLDLLAGRCDWTQASQGSQNQAREGQGAEELRSEGLDPAWQNQGSCESELSSAREPESSAVPGQNLGRPDRDAQQSSEAQAQCGQRHVDQSQQRGENARPAEPAHKSSKRTEPGGDVEETRESQTDPEQALVLDCYEALWGVCGSAGGPAVLLSRGAVPALCQAYVQNQALSRERALPLLGQLLSGPTRTAAWQKHAAQLSDLLARRVQEFCQAPDLHRVELCAGLLQFLPPPGGAPLSDGLKESVTVLWGGLRPLIQARISPAQLGSVLVLSACMLDLCGWAPLGSTQISCLLVNRACVEIRMGLEEPPGTVLAEAQQQTLTACYRILEAALEQACSLGLSQDPAQPQRTDAGLSRQQSRQLFGVLEEAFSAIVYYLQQVTPSCYGDPFIFATVRALCAWLAEETSCLREEVTALLPFLIGYAREQLQGARGDQGQADRPASDSAQGSGWPGEDALRFLLPALCHLTAEDGPRGVLLSLGTPVLLTDFLSRGWKRLQGGRGTRGALGDPGMETACSALLNIVVTEPSAVRTDACFSSLLSLLTDALCALLHKPHLLVLAANFCTLGLLIGRLRPGPAGPDGEPGQQRFFSAALRFLGRALCADPVGLGPAQLSPGFSERWDEVCELWRLGLQALAGCVDVLPWLPGLAREGGWLGDVLALLGSCTALPDPDTQGALQAALTALALRCPLCRGEILAVTRSGTGGVLPSMAELQRALTAGPLGFSKAED
ncbi:neurochondrin isoform X1 [Lepisosteus oculatus]|uniref:neurochondrin isoform X1 n=2 Tax=Lepisosteus oculatus TaxID=7918 RepID=UPI0035F50FFA